ncbi:septal ring lytic transglycosylase RlpA family protein [Aromatoleum evansii]|uniref:septal ring lytic transglycosylase RlpA family protein n=1 Tax=Aromatoleum evansii TaxID=59406 RepID=UPI00145E59E2|nr:septal ring lytic transglycosylase RlpA family protein [Aromatoleum evansii]NMG28003.1 septal ring lytic transglycosylase RlpA family protein [Aromatoleum evansii]
MPTHTLPTGPSGYKLLFAGLIAAVLALAGCSTTPYVDGSAATQPQPVPGKSAVVQKRGGAYYKDDGPGDNPPANLDDIPDAQPRAEPLHRFANRPYNVFGEDYVPAKAVMPFRQLGRASWYGKRFHGKPTSSGEAYDMYAMTAAHPTLPIPSYARVTHRASGRSVVVRINDRGPFHKGRVMDLSYAAAHRLGYVNVGSAEVEVEAIVPDGVEMIATEKPIPPLPGRRPAALVPPTPAPAEPPVQLAMAEPSTLTDATSGIFLQLGAFSTAASAEGFRGMVRDTFAEHAERLEVLADGKRYRLHLGPFASVTEAKAEAERIARELKFRPFVVTR